MMFPDREPMRYCVTAGNESPGALRHGYGKFPGSLELDKNEFTWVERFWEGNEREVLPAGCCPQDSRIEVLLLVIQSEASEGVRGGLHQL